MREKIVEPGNDVANGESGKYKNFFPMLQHIALQSAAKLSWHNCGIKSRFSISSTSFSNAYINRVSLFY